tara:strand:+ start:476 stop:646 length:171 start_codon:yes stop_codon:yes gene_type:complete
VRGNKRAPGHTKKNRRDRKTRKLRRARPRAYQTEKHRRELEKRLRRDGQPVFGEEE